MLDIDNEKQFIKDFDNKNHAIAKAYQKGIDKADFILDSKLFEMAKNGDLKAIQKYEERKRDRLYDAEREKRERN